MISLPNKPSELITIALDDMRKVEANPLYSVYMYDWHLPSKPLRNGEVVPCNVCMAGAVMAGTLGAAITDELTPSHYRYMPAAAFAMGTTEKLQALDDLRRGDLLDFIYSLSNAVSTDLTGAEQPTMDFIVSDGRLPEYDEEEPTPFYSYLRKYAAQLEASGF